MKIGLGLEFGVHIYSNISCWFRWITSCFDCIDGCRGIREFRLWWIIITWNQIRRELDWSLWYYRKRKVLIQLILSYPLCHPGNQWITFSFGQTRIIEYLKLNVRFDKPYVPIGLSNRICDWFSNIRIFDVGGQFCMRFSSFHWFEYRSVFYISQ